MPRNVPCGEAARLFYIRLIFPSHLPQGEGRVRENQPGRDCAISLLAVAAIYP
jgi:hypothetical protein